MNAVECPFFPGKLCCGVCANNEALNYALEEESKSSGLSKETIQSTMRTSFISKWRASINMWTNAGMYSMFENLPEQ